MNIEVMEAVILGLVMLGLALYADTLLVSHLNQVKIPKE